MPNSNYSYSSFNSLNSQPSSKSSLKRRFSDNRFLTKAKGTTKSLVNQVLDKRHSLDSKRSNLMQHDNNSMSTSSQSQLDEQQSNNRQSTLNSIKKRFSYKSKSSSTHNELDSNKSNESLASMTDATTNSTGNSSTLHIDHYYPVHISSAAENEVLSGKEKPGSFAIACDLRLANEKKNIEFHELFKTVPETDLLIEHYNCALQKDILLQGSLYVSEHHVCFKSNIFGWVTNLVIKFSEITHIEKRMTAKIIPNGILISTSTSTHIFASFLSRDHAYDQVMKIWDLSKRANSAKQDRSSISVSIEDLEDDDNTDDEISSTISFNDETLMNPIPTTDQKETNARQLPNLNRLLSPVLNNRPRSASDSLPKNSSVFFDSIRTTFQRNHEVLQIPNHSHQNNQNDTNTTNSIACPCVMNNEQSYNHIALNETYTGTVDAMARLLFNSPFSKSFLENYESFEDVQFGVWKNGSRQVTGKRKIKRSTSGTKMINILCEDQKLHKKIPYYCCILTKKSMPDMPMGAIYSILTRTCITHVNNDKVHVLISFQVVFSKTGLVSSIIEKNAADDQLKLYSHLNSVLKKSDLVRELIKDQYILQELKLDQSNSRESAETSLIATIAKLNFLYIGLFFVFITHFILAIRVQRITYHLEHFRHQRQPTSTPQWIDEKIHLFHQHLYQLKDEVEDFDRRISKKRTESMLNL